MAALKNLYNNMTPNERKLKFADYMGFTVIPTIASAFIAGYWILGMMKYSSPDWSAYTFLIPDYEVLTAVARQD